MGYNLSLYISNFVICEGVICCKVRVIVLLY
jgi:hypothetical protein